MARHRKYKDGYIVNEYEIIAYNHMTCLYTVRCIQCEKTLKMNNNLMQNKRCDHKPKRQAKCNRWGRASGLTYENPPERLEEIKRKYANGVTPEIMQEFAEKLL